MSGVLNGKAIVNTRAVHQAEALNRLLRARGAVALDYPCIAIMPPQDSRDLDQSLIDLIAGRFGWLILTSANTVIALAQRLKILGITLKGAAFRTAVVGPATAEAARESLGLEQILFPTDHIAEALAHSLPIEIGTRVLLPESAIARPTLADMLAARGAEVHVVAAYETVCGEGGVDLAHRPIDALTFTSSSTVTGFLERLSKGGVPADQMRALCAACSGPKSAATARDCGFTALIVPTAHTLAGLVDGLERYFA